MSHPADAHAAHAKRQVTQVIGRRALDTADIGVVVTGDGAEHDGRVFHRARHWPAGIECKCIGQHAAPAHQSVSRFETDDAAVGRRHADGAASVAADRNRQQASRDRGAGTAAGAARQIARFPGVHRRRPRQVPRRSAVGEFVSRQFAEQQAARLLHLRFDRGVMLRNVVLQDFRLAGRQYSRGADDILQTVRDTRQRAEGATAHDLFFRLACALKRDLRCLRDETMQAGFMLFHTREQILHDLDRRCGALAVQIQQLRYGCILGRALRDGRRLALRRRHVHFLTPSNTSLR